MSPSSYLVKGDNAIVVDQELRRLAHELLGEVDPSVGLEEVDLDLPTKEERAGAVSWLLDAMRTPPFLVERRVVIGHHVGSLSADEARELVDALGQPTPGVFVLLSHAGGRIPPGVAKAVEETRSSALGQSAGDKRAWWAKHLATAPVKLDAKAGKLIQDHLGEEAGRLEGLLATLTATYGEGASVSAAQVAPFLGSTGTVPSWELTDPIMSGSIPASLRALHRFDDADAALRALVRFTGQLQAVDGPGFTSVAEVSAATGMKPYPAEKTLNSARAFGSERIARAVQLCAKAELDSRGASGLESISVLEVLVARLAQMASVGARR